LVIPGRLLAALVLIVGLALAAQQEPDPKVVFEEAQAALARGHYAEAERGFREVLRMSPDLAAAHAKLGVVFMRTNRLNEAIEAFTKARELAPHLTGIDLNLGLAFYRQRNFPEAIPAFSRALDTRPGAFQPRFLLGLSYFMTDDYAHTVQTLEPLSSQEKTDLDYLYVMGICCGKLKRQTDSDKTFEQLVLAGGETGHMQLLPGKAYLDLFEIPSAQKELEKAVALAPALPFAHLNLGVAYQRQGMLEQAGEEFKKEMTVTPREPWSYDNLGTVYADRGDTGHAAEMFRKALALDGRMPPSLAGLGKTLLREGKAAEALPSLKRAVEGEPGSTSYHYLLGQAYLKLAEQTDADKQFAAARRIQIESVESQTPKMPDTNVPPEAPSR